MPSIAFLARNRTVVEVIAARLVGLRILGFTTMGAMHLSIFWGFFGSEQASAKHKSAIQRA